VVAGNVVIPIATNVTDGMNIEEGRGMWRVRGGMGHLPRPARLESDYSNVMFRLTDDGKRYGRDEYPVRHTQFYFIKFKP
jgi:hypothetical protein